MITIFEKCFRDGWHLSHQELLAVKERRWKTSSATNVGITGKNDLIVDTKFLKVKLMETVTWSADGHTETSARQIASSEIYVTENALWLEAPCPASYQKRTRSK